MDQAITIGGVIIAGGVIVGVVVVVGVLVAILAAYAKGFNR